jgi:hypothetical protein
MSAYRRRLVVSAVLALSLAGLGTPAYGQDASPAPDGSPVPVSTPAPEARLAIAGARGSNLALTLIEAKPSFFVDTLDLIRDGIGDTYLRRASVADAHDDFAAMILLRNRDLSGPLQARLDAFDVYGDLKGTQTFLGSVVNQKAGLGSARFDRVGFVVAAETDFKEDEAPKLDNALLRLRRTPGVILTARGVGPADVIVFYEVGSGLRRAAITAQTVDRILRTSRLEPVAEGIILAEPR